MEEKNNNIKDGKVSQYSAKAFRRNKGEMARKVHFWLSTSYTWTQVPLKGHSFPFVMSTSEVVIRLMNSLRVLAPSLWNDHSWVDLVVKICGSFFLSQKPGNHK